jgi:maleylpyruvate isomerase
LAPSELEGWTVGHVMTHIARNADGFTRMIEAAEAGEVGDQYEGGRAGREAGIAAGASRDWDALVADVVDSSTRLDAAFAATTDEVWATGEGDLLAGVEPVRTFPHRRAREVEIHRLDLGLGASYPEWTDGFVAREWPLSVARLPARLPDGGAVRLVVDGDGDVVVAGEGSAPVELRGTRRELLAWIVGRRAVEGAPSLASWP